MDISALKFAFNQAANSDLAVPMAAYVRDQFDYLGIKSPERRDLSKNVIKASVDQEELVSLVDTLWGQGYREYQYVAIDILKRRKGLLTSGDLPWIQHLILTDSWWDTVDALASHGMGAILRSDAALRRSTVREWVGHEDLWVRRSCIIFQLFYKHATDTKLLREVIIHQMSDTDFFIQKAIGWALRQYSKVDADWVRSLLAELELSALARREAGKYL